MLRLYGKVTNRRGRPARTFQSNGKITRKLQTYDNR